MSEPTIREIIEAAAETFNVPVGQVLSQKRSRHYARPRQVAAYLARSLTHHSTTSIGRAMDRDHATVLHATRVIGDLMNRDARTRELVERTRTACQVKADARGPVEPALIELGSIVSALREVSRATARAANLLEGLGRMYRQTNENGRAADSDDQA